MNKKKRKAMKQVAKNTTAWDAQLISGFLFPDTSFEQNHSKLSSHVSIGVCEQRYAARTCKSVS